MIDLEPLCEMEPVIEIDIERDFEDDREFADGENDLDIVADDERDLLIEMERLGVA